jgi:hypothetical protein
VWLADAALDSGSGSIWIAVAALATAIGGVLVALITTRRNRGSHRSEVLKGQDEAVRVYRKTFVEPEMKRLQARVTRAEDRAEVFRKRWDDCEAKRHHD